VNAEKKLRKALKQAASSLEQSPVNPADALVSVKEAVEALDNLASDWKIPCTRPLEEWCYALRSQAELDLRAIDVILTSETSDKPWATVAMLFQMVFEKISKAVFARSDPELFRVTLGKHTSFSKFFKALSNQRKYSNLKYAPKVLLLKLQALEQHHPSVTALGHLEYPWEDAHTLAVKLPSELPIVRELADPGDSWAGQARRFARQLLTDFDSAFPK
jgi:hypothetical protein